LLSLLLLLMMRLLQQQRLLWGILQVVCWKTKRGWELLVVRHDDVGRQVKASVGVGVVVVVVMHSVVHVCMWVVLVLRLVLVLLVVVMLEVWKEGMCVKAVTHGMRLWWCECIGGCCASNRGGRGGASRKRTIRCGRREELLFAALLQLHLQLQFQLQLHVGVMLLLLLLMLMMMLMVRKV
jgi:hypothetical protein